MLEPASTHWKRRVLIAAAISLLACGLMVAASFMPWLGKEGGRTFSGWDLYEAQRDAGMDDLLIPRFFTDASGEYWPFWTGLATLIGALWLAGTALVFGVVFSLLRRRRLLSAVAVVPLMVSVVIGAIPIGTQAMFYVEGGPSSGASLEYGLIVLWAAAVVAILAPVYGAVGLSKDYQGPVRTVPSAPSPRPT